MFWTYILANSFAFIERFISLFAFLLIALIPMPNIVIKFATIFFFMLVASIMIMVFGLRLYVMLAPVCLSIAILLLGKQTGASVTYNSNPNATTILLAANRKNITVNSITV